MKLKTLSAAMILATVPMTGAFAAAMDRSGQSISAFLQPGNYAEAGFSVLDPNVSGKTTATYGSQNTGDMAGDYYFPSAALKLQLNEKFSVGLLYDQPFGADAEYSESVAFTHATQGQTKAEVKSNNLSLIFGYQPTENWNLYGGAVYQSVKGEVHLRGAVYSGLGGYNGATALPSSAVPAYDAVIDNTSGYGWLAGVAYQIPEIALKASLTYRSEIDHDVRIKETLAPLSTLTQGAVTSAYTEADTTITTPQSVNFDFQTGIAANTVAFANIRWVDWSSFAIRPNKFGQVSNILGPQVGQPNGFDLVAYDKDQWSVNAGIGRKLSDKWGANVSVGWDSGAGNPVSTLGPTEGYWSLGLGAQYSPAENYFVQAGVKYFWLGDAKAQSGSDFGTSKYAAEFKDNHAIGYGLKFGYKF